MDLNAKISADYRKLLKKITKKEVSQEYVNIVMSQLKQEFNLITEQEVKNSIKGIQHKFLIHAEYGMGQKFIELVTKFIKLTAPNGLTHPTWSILYLLIRTAYHPTERSSMRQENFVGCLSTDNRILSHNAVSSTNMNEISCHNEIEQKFQESLRLSESSDEDSEKFTCETFIQPVPVNNSSKFQKEEFPVFQVPKIKKLSIPLHSLIQTRNGTMNSNAQVEIWTEYQLLHELAWALKTCDLSNLKFAKSILDSKCLKLIKCSLPLLNIDSLSLFVQRLTTLNSFIENIISQETLTYQAYAAALSNVTTRFYQSLSSFEQSVSEQACSITLNHFLIFLKPWQHRIHALCDMHESIIETYDSLDNHHRVSRLFSKLFHASLKAQVTSYSGLFPLLLQLLASTLEPFLNMVDVWLMQGQLLDPYQEFGIIRNETISPQNEQYWFDSLFIFSSHESENFLHPLMDDILLGGRSVELLTQLNRSLMITNSQLGVLKFSSKSLMDSFCEHFNNRVERPSCTSPTSFNTSANAHLSEKQHKNNLLSNTFQSFRNGRRCDRRHEFQPPSSKALVTPPDFYPLLPLLERSLLEPIRIRQRLVSKALIDTLYEKCALRAHILTLRQIHLMQAGDIMGRFCLLLFQKFNTGEKWANDSSLTLSLHSCMSPRMYQCYPFISVTIEKDNYHNSQFDLSNIQINYKVPWPINLVITKESLKLYNNVLTFLLQLKLAMVSLQRLSFKELGGSIGTEGSAMINHRLLLLRAWLLYFVSSVDNYLMECVLECSHTALDEQMDKATNLGEIIDSHKKYVDAIHKQCLQQPSGTFLRDAINEVLSVSVEISSAWINGIELDRLAKLEECYVRNHQFVAAILATDAVNSMLPNVETLAAALIHSCPTT